MTKKKIPDLLNKGAVVVDVRTRGEFSAGHREGSLNIPLDALERQLSQLDRNRPVIVCCASGSRSGVAKGILEANGFSEVLNAGPWENTVS